MMNMFLTTLLTSAPEAEQTATNLVEVPEGLWDRFIFGLQFSGIGMAVVFIVLIILMIVLKIFERVFAGSSKKANAEESAPTVAAPAPAPTAAPVAADDDAMLAAVIAAAVEAYYDNAQAQANVPAYARKKYQIRSFRRI